MNNSPSSDVRTKLAELLEQTGRAHHQAFIEVDGDDPEWPHWYARYLFDPLHALGLHPGSLETLASSLAGLDESFRAQETGKAWPDFYARGLIERFAGG